MGTFVADSEAWPIAHTIAPMGLCLSLPGVAVFFLLRLGCSTTARASLFGLGMRTWRRLVVLEYK